MPNLTSYALGGGGGVEPGQNIGLEMFVLLDFVATRGTNWIQEHIYNFSHYTNVDPNLTISSFLYNWCWCVYL